jgi:broad specificity phosphatase PhoE
MCKDGRLDERSLGELEKKPRRFIAAYSQGDLRYAPPGGESYLQLTQRVLSFLLDLRKTITDESYILVATHVGPMRIIAGVLEEMKKPADVLGLNFTHARPYRFDLSRLKWPQFLNAKEVLDDRAESTESCRYTEISSTLYQ